MSREKALITSVHTPLTYLSSDIVIISVRTRQSLVNPCFACYDDDDETRSACSVNLLHYNNDSFALTASESTSLKVQRQVLD